MKLLYSLAAMASVGAALGQSPALGGYPLGGPIKPQHPSCHRMASYQASYIAKEYNFTRHMGHFYELGFRDLYLPPPQCDCQHTYKIIDDEKTEKYHEDFEFSCKNIGRLTSIIGLDSVSTTQPGVYNQTIQWSNPAVPIPDINELVFNTATIAFKTVPEQEQYEWVIEFTCGTQPEDAMAHLFPGGFVGLNMYSRSGPTNADNLQEMEEAVKDLGLDWVMQDWGWGFHEVPHTSECQYNSPDEQEYACEEGQCVPVRWGMGTHLSSCETTCM